MNDLGFSVAKFVKSMETVMLTYFFVFNNIYGGFILLLLARFPRYIVKWNPLDVHQIERLEKCCNQH